MDIYSRVICVLGGGIPDHLPMLIYSNHLPRGRFEREVRNMGLGLDVRCSVYKAYMPNVRIEERRIGDYVYTVYHTPRGRLSMTTRVGLRFQLPGGSWVIEHPVKSIEDVEALRCMIRDTTYESSYDEYLQLRRDLDGDGVVTVGADYTPLMKLIVKYMGFKNFALILMKRPDIIDNLVREIDEKYEEMYRVIADSPAEIVRIGDNMDGRLVSPKLFEKYCLPYYNKYARILKSKGKKVISHMDGRLRTLKNLIARVELDAIEAFTPPPGGDLPVDKAREAWKGKVIWMNFPEAVFLKSSEEVEVYTLNLLKEISPGVGFILSITEDIHPDHLEKGLKILVETVYRYGRIPIEANLRD
ncbi:MAG: uroporphyrinogen decarboxylase family protein [Candidatus Bathyarchaeia archaeon]